MRSVFTVVLKLRSRCSFAPGVHLKSVPRRVPAKAVSAD
jgi:hypothetical protein